MPSMPHGGEWHWTPDGRYYWKGDTSSDEIVGHFFIFSIAYDLLPDREAATLAVWLKRHPGIEIISRDRSPTYASGIYEGAPAAVQVADRFHLLMNVREALEKVVKRCNRFLRTLSLARPPSSAPAPENDAYTGCRLRMCECFGQFGVFGKQDTSHVVRKRRVRENFL